MASYDPHRPSSMNIPPKMGSSLKCHEKEFIELYNRDFPELQQSMSKLSNIITTYSDNSRSAIKGIKDGFISEVAGSVIMGVGIALTPFTLGASAVVAGAGVAVITGGRIGEMIWSFKNRKLETNFIKDFKVEMNTFQNKLIPMSNKMKALHQCVEEILKYLKNPKQCVDYLEKHFDSAAELVNFIQIYDAGGLAKILSETVNLTGIITEMLTDASTGAEIKIISDKFVKVMDTIETTKISLGQ